MLYTVHISNLGRIYFLNTSVDVWGLLGLGLDELNIDNTVIQIEPFIALQKKAFD